MKNLSIPDLLSNFTKPVFLIISRHEIEHDDLASVLARLKAFLVTQEVAWRNRGQMLLSVDGYNDDPRELVDIVQVRTFLAKLEAQWPYWAFFFNQADDSIELLFLCATGKRFLGRGSVEIDPRLVANAMANGFFGINKVFKHFDFPENERILMSNGLVNVLKRSGIT